MTFIVTALLLSFTPSGDAAGKEPKATKKAVEEPRQPPAEKRLKVPHHGQSTQVWCWAASIAMIAEFLSKQPVSDCAVASRLDLANGGVGRCCDSDGHSADPRCVYGRRYAEMTEVLNWYFHLTATEMHRALTWDELKGSIDAGYPVLAGLYWGGGMGHAVVLVGYREPNIVLVDDPWLEVLDEPLRMPYEHFARGRSKSWYGSWYLKRDAISGYLSGDSHTPRPTHSRSAQGPARPATATVNAALPLLDDASTRKTVQARLTTWLDPVRECYETGLAENPPPPSPATLRLGFAVDKSGSPTWISTKDAAGLPKSVTKCVTDEVSRWTGLFPHEGKYDESQRLELTFASLAPTPAGGETLRPPQGDAHLGKPPTTAAEAGK